MKRLTRRARPSNDSRYSNRKMRVKGALRGGMAVGLSAGLLSPLFAPAQVMAAVLPSQWAVYVTNFGSNSVSVINSNTGRVFKNIPVGVNPDGITMSPDTNYAFVANRGSGTVSVIDVNPKDGNQFDTVVATIPVGTYPAHIAFGAYGNYAYVTNQGNHTISVIDTNPNSITYRKVVGTISDNSMPGDVVAAPQNSTLQMYSSHTVFVTNPNVNNVGIVDTNVNDGTQYRTIDEHISSTTTPQGMAFSKSGNHLYVTTPGSNLIDVIDTNRYDAQYHALVATISSPDFKTPVDIALAPSGNTAYVVNKNGNDVALVDTNHSSTNYDRVIGTIGVGLGPQSVAVSPDGNEVFVTNETSNTVSIIDTNAADPTNNQHILFTVPTQSQPMGVAVSPHALPDLTANFVATSEPAGQATTFNASGSTDSMGSIATYRWTFGDNMGLTTSSPIVSHVYAAPGQYTVTLTVTDQNGTSSATTTRQIDIGLTATSSLWFSHVTSQGWITNWSPVPGASTYDISLNGVRVATGITATSYSFANESPGTTYQVMVTAVDSSGQTGTAATGSVETLGTSNYFAVLSPATPDGSNDWYVHPVWLTLPSDAYVYSLNGGQTWHTYTWPVTFWHTGTYRVMYGVRSSSGPVSQMQTVWFQLDTTAPVIHIQSPRSRTYAQNGVLKLAFSVTDQGSGVNSAATVATLDGKPVTDGQSIAVNSLSPGKHTLTVTAMDMAGNKSKRSVVFDVNGSQSNSLLKNLVLRFEGDGEINNRGIANSLLDKIDARDWNGFVHEVEAQSGKHITVRAAWTLLWFAKFSEVLPNGGGYFHVGDHGHGPHGYVHPGDDGHDN